MADVLNITLSESLLLRIVNDSPNGRAVDALQNHENILGPQAKRILAFWRYLDGLDKECWHEFRDAFVLLNRNQPSYPPMRLAWLFVDRDGSAYEEALEMCARVRIATSQSVWKGSAGVRGNAAKAANEIQAYEAMRPLGYEPHYLPMFGIDALEDLD